jgi:hypothetical protein
MVNYFEILQLFFKAKGVFNAYIWQLYEDFYWDKHQSAATIIIIICHVLLSRTHKLRNYFFMIPVLPVIIGMRSLVLGFILSILSIKLKKAKHPLLTSFVFLMFIFIFTTVFWNDIYETFMSERRATGYVNIFYIISNYPFGVGHGVYHDFVNYYSTFDFSDITGQEIVSDSPESDIVYAFGSFGLLFGLIFYFTLSIVFFKLWKMYPYLKRPDKFFALIYIYFFFAGIGEDWMFGFGYWILFGFALGVVTAKRNNHLLFQAIRVRENINLKPQQNEIAATINRR